MGLKLHKLIQTNKTGVETHAGFSIKAMIQIPLLVSLLLGFSLTAFAKIENNQFIQRHWGEEQGLPVGDINGMVQDSQGYIWLASLDGLIRFDGNEFTQFDTSNSNLSSSRFTTIRKAKNDALWLSSDEGELIRFVDSKARTFSQTDGMPHSRIVRITPIGDKNIAYGTLNGVLLIQGKNIVGLGLDKVNGDVKAIHWPKLDSLWVATNAWLYHIVNPLTKIQVIKTPMDKEALALMTYNKQLWMGTHEGLYQFNGQSFHKKYKQINSPVQILRLLPKGDLLIGADKLWQLSKDNLMVVSNMNKDSYLKPLFVENRQGQIFYQGVKSLWLNGEIVAKFDSQITSLIQENSGGIIIATKKQGLTQLKHNTVRNIGIPQGLPKENIYPVYQTKNDFIIIAENSADTYLLNKKGQFIKTIKNAHWVKSIYQVNNQTWLVGDTICILNQDKDCEPYPLDFIQDINPINLVFQDKKGQIWLSTRLGGLWYYQNKQWQKLNQVQHNWKVSTLVKTVTELNNGDLLFGTNGNGIIRVHNNKVLDDSSTWGLPSRFIRSILEVNSGQLMVGTQDRGLCRVNLAKKTSQCLSKQNNLISITIHYLFQDKKQRIWWSSNRGVYWQKLSDLMDVFDGKRQTLPNGGRYDKNNGMRNSEANGGAFPAGFVDKNDQLWIPTQQGLAVFDTNETKLVPTVNTIIQSILIDGKDIEFDTGLDLKAKQRTFQVKLTALSYYDPKNIEFRYRQFNQTNDKKNNWTAIGSNRLVSFHQLSSGSHQLEFQARNLGGQWQKSSAKLKINIQPYWVETLLFKLLILLIFLSIIAGYIRWRNKKLIQRSKTLEKMVKDRTLELKQMGDKRTAFFANISHELRTPLTLILGPLDDAIIEHNSLKFKDLKLVHQSAQRMKRLVDQMLDLQKIDAKKLQLEQNQQHLLNFLNACIEPFQVLAKSLEVRLFIQPQSIEDYANIWVKIDVEQMEKVIGNLLSNAFKFSNKGNKIELQLEIIDQQIAIKVLDNGPGIPQGANERIFKRFSQELANNNSNYQGTGIGLALVKEIIVLHGGTVKANNRPTVGACFTITLPFKQIANKEPVNLSVDENQLLESVEINEPEVSHKKEPLQKTENTATVLIVEDNKDLQSYIASHLQSEFNLLFADDGQQGLHQAQTHMPDIIVSDVMMPNMSGFEMAKALRQDMTTNFIPFLFLTAKITAQDEIKGFKLGADDYISKPFSGSLLIARIHSILDARERLKIALQHNQHFIKKLSNSSSIKTRAINAIYEHISDPEFNVEVMAKTLNMSRTKLFRLLKTEYQLSASDLIRQVRMQEAQKLLQQKMGNVSEVSFAVGYANLSHFSKIYKKTFGHSPSSD